MMLISVILLVQSIIPTMAMLDDLGVRGATSAYFFGFVVPESDASLLLDSAFGVWPVNIILPAIVGLVFVFNANFYGGTGGNDNLIYFITNDTVVCGDLSHLFPLLELPSICINSFRERIVSYV